MRSTFARIVALTLLGTCLQGCHRSSTGAAKEPPGAPPIVPVPNIPSQLTMSDEDMALTIDRLLNSLQPQIIESMCQGYLTGPNRDSTAAPNLQLGPGTSGTGSVFSSGHNDNGYAIWLRYVADHIKSNTLFDQDYAAVAANALSGPLADLTGDTCLNARYPKDTDQMQVNLSINAAEVGERLLNAFEAYDQDTRNRAARYLGS
jgi:hypothetical protein